MCWSVNSHRLSFSPTSITFSVFFGAIRNAPRRDPEPLLLLRPFLSNLPYPSGRVNMVPSRKSGRKETVGQSQTWPMCLQLLLEDRCCYCLYRWTFKSLFAPKVFARNDLCLLAAAPFPQTSAGSKAITVRSDLSAELPAQSFFSNKTLSSTISKKANNHHHANVHTEVTIHLFYFVQKAKNFLPQTSQSCGN